MVEVRKLTKRFGAFVAVEDISFVVRAGESFALLGPNGSGKTTILKCIAGLTIPDAGSITVGGFDLARNSHGAAALFSYLPQRVAFPDNLTAEEVLEFYRRLRRLPPERATEALAQSALNLNGGRDKITGAFSGGMTQRLGIAVATLANAPLMLLDEPVASLDPQGATAFRGTLHAWKQQGKTIIFSTHVLSDVESLADRVAVLVSGRLVAIESIEELRSRVSERARLTIVTSGPAAQVERVALAAGAAEAKAEGHALVISCHPDLRLPITRAIEQAGAVIERFHTEEPNLEEIYLKYVDESNVDTSARANERLR